MNVTATAAETQKDLPGLSLLARETLRTNYVGSVNGSPVYQVGAASWQSESLRAAPRTAVIHNAASFEAAAQSTDFSVIYVPLQASLTQEIATRILNRNALSKTIFWEIKE